MMKKKSARLNWILIKRYEKYWIEWKPTVKVSSKHLTLFYLWGPCLVVGQTSAVKTAAEKPKRYLIHIMPFYLSLSQTIRAAATTNHKSRCWFFSVPEEQLAEHAVWIIVNRATCVLLAESKNTWSQKSIYHTHTHRVERAAKMWLVHHRQPANYDLWSEFPPVELVALSAPFERRFLRSQPPKRIARPTP
jgi:hypothetical protein